MQFRDTFFVWEGTDFPLFSVFLHPFFGVRIVRLAEIEVVPEYLEAYLTYAKEVGETSVKVEPGVLTLFSMQTKEDPCKIYILEIYADKEAYLSLLQTAHFKKNKEGTALMLKSLKLIDSNPLVKLEFGKLKVKY